MVLGGKPPGRVGRRRDFSIEAPRLHRPGASSRPGTRSGPLATEPAWTAARLGPAGTLARWPPATTTTTNDGRARARVEGAGVEGARPADGADGPSREGGASRRPVAAP